MNTTSTTPVINTANVHRFEALNASDDFEKIATPIVEKIKPFIEHYRLKLTSTRPVIAIAGCSGVGKSYFAGQLLEHLQKIGINAKILKFDDFLDPEPFEGALEDIHPHFDYHKAQDFLKEVLEGKEIIEKPAWNQDDLSGTERPFKVKEPYDLRGTELLIVEGEFTLCDEKTYDFVKLSHVRVAIDATDSDLMHWGWERGRYSNRQFNSYEDYAKERIGSLSKYRKLLEPLIEKYADFTVQKENNHHYLLSAMPGK